MVKHPRIFMGRPRSGKLAGPTARSNGGGTGRRAVTTVLLLAFVAASFVVGTPNSVAGAETPPAAEAFYQVPSPLPPGRPGAVIEVEVVEAPEGFVGTLRRVLYHSRSVAGADIAVSGLIATPDGAAPVDGWPVITWAHGTTGLADACAPSKGPDVAAFAPLVAQGYAVVATDYEGLGTPGRHPYIVGPSEGRGVLDIVRAARTMSELQISDRVVIWGHSQGGHAALWAAQIAPTWAPELSVLGTVAGAPPSQLQFVYQALQGSPFRYYLLMAAAGINAAYPQADLSQVLTPEALAKLGVIDTACGGDVGRPYDGDETADLIAADPNTVEPWKALIAAQEPGTVKLAQPVLIIQGGNDEQIPVASSALLEARMCGLGQVVARRVYPGQSHAGVIPVSYAQMSTWIADRFAGLPAPDDCRPTKFLDEVATGVLGRSLTSAEQSRYLSELGSPTSPELKAPVVKRLSRSLSAAHRTVDRAYRDLLGRPPDPAALRTWSADLVSGRRSAANVITALAGSREFEQTIGDVAAVERPGARVAALYTELLGRPATAAEVTEWLGQSSRRQDQAPRILVLSPEGRRHRADQLIRGLLDRPASQAEAALGGAQLTALGEPRYVANLVGTFDFDR